MSIGAPCSRSSKADRCPRRCWPPLRERGDEIEPDYELAELLIALGKNQPLTPAVMDAAAVAAFRSSSSPDYEMRRALTPAIASATPLPPAVLRDVLESVARHQLVP